MSIERRGESEECLASRKANHSDFQVPTTERTDEEILREELEEKTFGESVSILRMKANLSLRKTSIRMGIDPAHLSRIQRGIKDIGIGNFDKLINVLGFDITTWQGQLLYRKAVEKDVSNKKT